MKHLSLLKKTTFACGILAAVAMVSSCSSTLSPEKAAQRLAQSPASSVFSHNDMNSPRFRDCYEAGPLPERTERALLAWLRNSTVRDFSYVYPQYYISTLNTKGGGEVIWAICSDGKGNMVGVLAPANKLTPAWDLPTIGSYKVYVCDTDEREALSTAIMESLADAGYDQVRIDTRKAQGLTEKRYLLSKPLNAEEQKIMEQERKAIDKALEDAKKKAAKDAAEISGKSDDSSDDEDEDDSSGDEDTTTSSSSDDDDSSSSDDDSSSSSDDDDDSGSSDDDGDSDLDDED